MHKGGYIMDYKIMEKEAFQVIGISKMFHMETSYLEIPAFWSQHFQSENAKYICGAYGICIESNGAGEEFEYLIADDYKEGKDRPDGCKVFEIAKHTWAVFPCTGPIPEALQEVNAKIFSEWLPNCKDYEFAGGYNIEYYSNPQNYENCTQDEKYYSEIWLPVKRK